MVPLNARALEIPCPGRTHEKKTFSETLGAETYIYFAISGMWITHKLRQLTGNTTQQTAREYPHVRSVLRQRVSVLKPEASECAFLSGKVISGFVVLIAGTVRRKKHHLSFVHKIEDTSRCVGCRRETEYLVICQRMASHQLHGGLYAVGNGVVPAVFVL